MRYIKDIIVSNVEPPVNNVAWLQLQSDNTYKLLIYGNNGWVPLCNIQSNIQSNIQTEFIEEIPNIVINN